MYITGEQMMEDDGKLVIGLRGSNRFECAKLVHSRQHRMGIADEHCQHVGILSRERGVSKTGVRIVYGRCTDLVHVGLCRLVCRSRG